MCNCCLGHKAADKYDMVSFFYAMLIDQQFDHDLQISAILGLKNCALTNFGQWKCREFEDLPGRLLDKCFIKNKVLQYNALEVCFQIPKIKFKTILNFKFLGLKSYK